MTSSEHPIALNHTPVPDRIPKSLKSCKSKSCRGMVPPVRRRRGRGGGGGDRGQSASGAHVVKDDMLGLVGENHVLRKSFSSIQNQPAANRHTIENRLFHLVGQYIHMKEK